MSKDAVTPLIEELKLCLPVYLQEIQAEWDGNEAGPQEERADLADEAQETWETLIEILERL